MVENEVVNAKAIENEVGNSKAIENEPIEDCDVFPNLAHLGPQRDQPEDKNEALVTTDSDVIEPTPVDSLKIGKPKSNLSVFF